MPKIIVTQEEWIQKGLEVFSQNGVDGLVIEKMASALGCSKSSFYWYFTNRNEFVERLIERWREISTEEVIRLSSIPDNPKDQISNMLIQMFSVTENGDFLFYIRKLGTQSPSYQAMLEAIEQQRIHYAQELFTKAGMDTEAAKHKSHILYHYYLGWYERHKHHPVGEEELQDHVSMLHQQLLGI